MKGYHGTCSSEKVNIQRNGLDPARTHYRKDHWLGQGVYFFEDQGHAHYWALILASRKGKNIFPLVYKADIVADETQVMDFDDNDNLSRFIDYSQELISAIREDCRKQGKGYPKFDEGTSRALFYDYYKREKGIKVMLRTYSWNYDRRVLNNMHCADVKEIEAQKYFTHILGARFNERQICVSDKNCIKNCVIVYDGEEAGVI